MHFPAKQPRTNDTWNWFEYAVGGVHHPQHTQTMKGLNISFKTTQNSNLVLP
jgi:hypothetical protein